MVTNSETEFKAEMLRMLWEIEYKADTARHENSFVYANYDSSEEDKVWEAGKTTAVSLMQSNPVWAFESFFDYYHKKGYVHFYPLELVKAFVPKSLPIQQELIAILKQILYENKLAGYRRTSMEMLGIILHHQKDEKLQHELIGFLLDEDPSMRLISLRIFSDLRDERAIPFLRLLLDEQDAPLRLQSYLALSQFKCPAAELALQEWRRENPER